MNKLAGAFADAVEFCLYYVAKTGTGDDSEKAVALKEKLQEAIKEAAAPSAEVHAPEAHAEPAAPEGHEHPATA